MTGLPSLAVHLLAALLVALGLGTVLGRRNLLIQLLGVELILGGAGLSFIGFAATVPSAAAARGQAAVLVAIAVAAAEAAVGLALVIRLHRRRRELDSDAWSGMEG